MKKEKVPPKIDIELLLITMKQMHELEAMKLERELEHIHEQKKGKGE